ncbi:hypothetical protein BV98_001992 [Sphingobium herbicidovorans NBRC 16415]|uniref:Uncharacterized protein n=1 Tax=Sphingobium herbicidovorans (strain ATCC 700291 / DSM 11019 / CCUG 56400 / KCTC 2939 / LMG 18315 / NBRC 16415 / MH) TaxID=1219045 RepID=A0A086P9X1_SPHHM|nr:hypothetical protein BV98_001992 [Sphingobium herbicidovorans NBRC 16415]
MSSGPDGNDFAAIIVATSVAQIVRTLQFTAVGTFLECFDAQRIVAAAHTAAGRGSFPLGDSHVGTLFHKLDLVKRLASIRWVPTPQAPQTHAARVIAKPCAYSLF